MKYAQIFEKAEGGNKSAKVYVDGLSKPINFPKYIDEVDNFLIIQSGIETFHIPKEKIVNVSIFDPEY